MKIVKYGNVIVSDENIRVEGFIGAREENDDPTATDEHLLLDVVITWALNTMTAQVNREQQRKFGKNSSAKFCGSPN